jgi:hypothetical protein
VEAIQALVDDGTEILRCPKGLRDQASERISVDGEEGAGRKGTHGRCTRRFSQNRYFAEEFSAAQHCQCPRLFFPFFVNDFHRAIDDDEESIGRGPLRTMS